LSRYLFGPVSASFASQNLERHRQSGDCLVFDVGGSADVHLGPDDSWDSVCARLPAGWRADFLVLHLAYRAIPAWLWEAPIPIVGLAGDWNLLWHHYRHCLGRCDLVLTDAAAVEVMHRAGFGQARGAVLFGCEKVHVEEARAQLGPLSPVLGGEGLGVRGSGPLQESRVFGEASDPPHPFPLPPSTGGEGVDPGRSDVDPGRPDPFSLGEEADRDIDVLFVGNFHPAVQAERLPWLRKSKGTQLDSDMDPSER
jgi:hypothetical protein